MAAVRVGAVTYLNARPLYRGLAAASDLIALELDHPSRLADRLAAGDLDVALIPSVEYFRGAASGYQVLPGFAIAARGPVWSVKLFARTRFHEIRRLALDAGSRTSRALARVWLAEAHGVRPPIIEDLPIGVSPLESTADAVLVIGDRAMKVPEAGFEQVVDLGAAWVGLTGLPFVFALWVVRPGVDLGELPVILEACRARGLAEADQIALEHASRLGLRPSDCYDYLTHVLSYELGRPELDGLKLFARKAEALGLVPKGGDIAFYKPRLDLSARR